ncbi:MAG TPA: hypothetical protein DCW86_02580 [Actinobacteria bacterium]|nr:hypothetical protein [Actinomycetota bacterium]
MRDHRSRKRSPIVVGYRTQKRLERRQLRRKRLKLFLPILSALLLVVLLALGSIFWFGGQDFLARVLKRQKPEVTRVSGPKEEPKKVKTTILVIGARENRDGELASGLLLMVYDSEAKKIGGVVFHEDTLVQIPGRGFERICEVLESGIPTTLATVKNFMGVPIDYYLQLDYFDFERIVSNVALENFFDKATKTSLSPSRRSELRGEIARVDSLNRHVIPLPVKPITVGRETYYEPKKDEVDHLVSLFWGVKRGEDQQVRVVVLNGCGLPGVAGEVAQKLIEGNYKVIDTKNADNFNYAKTQILVYNEHHKSTAFKIKDLLGVGVILSKSFSQDLADIAVVVGKDYRPAGQGETEQ